MRGLCFYVWIAFALRKRDHTFKSFIRSLNPAQVAAGLDGKGSLSTFQTLAFSLVVVALISLLLLQTGMLADISGSILTLLGHVAPEHGASEGWPHVDLYQRADRR